jgi:formylglycine-generating enzyme required for sulfatase activity/DNA integrity scanning protein DisA with diadenylate cyclase activity
MYKVDLSSSISLNMISIPSGEFWMGSPDGENGQDDSEGPQHSVSIQSFHMSQFPITQTQWQIVASLPKVNIHLDSKPSYFKGDNYPVEQVTWEEAQEFCARLSNETNQQYRLPSEAEWEYACRAGTITPFCFGHNVTQELVNYGRQIGDRAKVKPSPPKQPNTIGKFPSNDYRLHDMHGNVWEWCLDTWHDNYKGAPSDGTPWIDDNAHYKVLRGGSWDDFPEDCRSASRIWLDPSKKYNHAGFRVVCLSYTEADRSIPNQTVRYPIKLPEITPKTPREKQFFELWHEQQLSLEELLLSIQIFGVASSGKIITKLKEIEISTSLFLKIAEYSKVLAQTTYESKLFSTAFVLTNTNQNDLLGSLNPKSISKVLGHNFFDQGSKTLEEKIKANMEEVIKVNGIKRVFVISSDQTQDAHRTFVRKIDQIGSELVKQVETIGDSRWRAIQYLVENQGCAFVLPGDGRVKLITQGEQIAEFSAGEWKLSRHKEIREKMLQIAEDRKLDKEIVIDVLRKCVYASETRKGFSILIENKDNLIEQQCDRAVSVRGDSQNRELQDCKITEFQSDDYLNIVAGDGAVILSKEGYTLAVQAFLKVENSESESFSFDGFGARHSSACEATKKSDAIAFVVSQDGRITIYIDGKHPRDIMR